MNTEQTSKNILRIQEIDVIDVVLVLLLLTLNIVQTFFFSRLVFLIVDFEQVNVSWVVLQAEIKNTFCLT